MWRRIGWIKPAELALLTDPQTSGGLLVSCAPQAVDEVLEVTEAERGTGEPGVAGAVLGVRHQEGDPGGRTHVRPAGSDD